MDRKNGTMKKAVLWSGFLLCFIPILSVAQEYPTRPINLLISVAPGGTRDTSTRVLASKVEKFMGQPFIMSNNGGGAGTVALGIMAKERPDGYHLICASSASLVLIPQLRTVAYKLEDFILIMEFGAQQTGVVVKADSPWKTFKEFVDYAKKNPGKVNYSTSGVGTGAHIAMDYVAKQEGIQWTNVPYTGDAPALTALLGGHISAVSGGSTWVPHVQGGALRLLATHGEKRMKIFPDIATFKEQGYDFTNEAMFLIAAPKGTPPPIVKKLDEAFQKGMEDPEFIETMKKLEIEVIYRNATDLKKYLEGEYTRLGSIITELKIPKESEKK
jgi:tripartite-type tricarboxylate transporter receptor subunit TctC